MQKIIVVDYGSQYNHLITRRIRDLGVYSELVHPGDVARIITDDPDIAGIILSGGPKSVYFASTAIIDKALFSCGIPILGICYGMQLIAAIHNIKVEEAKTHEYGKVMLELTNNASSLFSGIDSPTEVFMSHKDIVSALPEGFILDASTLACPIAAFHHHDLPIYGVQFHPEVAHTKQGNKLLENFIYKVAKARKNWDMSTFIENEIQNIKTATNNKKVLLGISGGVDSTVAAILIGKAIGDNLTCVFVDHGLLREQEVEAVTRQLKERFTLNVVALDQKTRFLKKLKGITDPERKRKTIGREFIRVFEAEARKLGTFEFLGQGTLYTDVIESGTTTAATIKSHHNVGGLPKKLKLKLLEPLNRLYKDEVRVLGKELGLPDDIVSRQPFPGPGLAIRIIGEVTEEKLAIARKTDWILQEEIRKAGLDRSIWQYFTVLSGIRTVGVMGDRRTYDYTIAIRAVTSVDGMTADWAKIPHETLDLISRRMVNEVNHVNRVVYDISSKPPATIEWE